MRLAAVAIAVACAAALPAPWAVARADEGGAVTRLAGVDLEGHLGDSKDKLIAFLGLTPESPFGEAEQARLNLLLSKLGYAQKNSEVLAAGPGHVRLHLVLEPMRVVRNIIVRHDWPFFDDEIIRHLTVRTGQLLGADENLRAALEEEAAKVRKYLANEGYFEATVNIVPHVAKVGLPRRLRPDWIDLVVILDLGSSYQLGTVEATYDHPDGADRLSRDKLYEIFHHWLRFKISEMREDQKKAEKVLRDQGFPAARVTTDFQFERDADRRTHKVKLLVHVVEKRKVEVRFVGNRAISGDELRDQLTLFSAGAYDEVELNESARMVQRAYQKHGYFEARVSFRRTLRLPPPDKPGHEVEEVTFTIDEGPELKVRRVDVVSETGAPLTFTQEDLKDKAELETRPFPPLGSIGLGEGGYVTQVQLSQDDDRLANLYKSRGFANVKVRAEVARDPAAFDALGVFGAEATGAGGGSDLYVRFIVDEGEREMVDHVEVSFVGPHIKNELDVLRVLRLGAGMPFTSQAVDADLEQRVKDIYKSSGHPLVEINPKKSSWDPDHKRVTLRYEITEGPEVHFGAILVRGNFKTHGFVIRRDLPFKPGDLFDYTKIEAAENNLQTHLIFNSARVEPQFPGPDEVVVGSGPLTVPVLVTVQEHYLEAAGALTFALGAASDRLPDYVYASAAYLWANVFGIGSQFELKGEYAFLAAARQDPVTWSLSARYTDVRVFGPGWRLDLTGFYREEVTARFGLIKTFGGSLGLTRNITQVLRAYARYDVYEANLSVGFLRILGNFDNTSVQDRTLITRAVSGVVWDKRVGADGLPNPLAPNRGWYLSGSVSYSHPNGPAPTQFLVFDGQVLGLLPFKVRGTEFSLLGNLRYSHGLPLGGQSALPLTERFYAGGDTTTRGYDPDTLKSEILYSSPSPLGGASAFRVVPEGGNIRFLNTIELQFPISKSFLGLPMVWSGALFFDSGAIVNGLDQFHWQDLRHSIGISLLRLITPVGPLSIEYAYPLTQTLAEERWKTAPWYTHFPGRIHFNWGIPLSRL